MKNRLSRARARINHRAIATLRKPLLISDARRNSQQMTERRFVFLTRFV